MGEDNAKRPGGALTPPARHQEEALMQHQPNPGPPILISDDADWDRPALLKLTNGKVVELDWTVREAGRLIAIALEDEVLIGGEIHPRLVEHIRAHTDGA